MTAASHFHNRNFCSYSKYSSALLFCLYASRKGFITNSRCHMQISTHRTFVAIVPYSSAMSIIRWWLSLDMLAIIETCPNSQHQQQQQQKWTPNTDTQQINIIYSGVACNMHYTCWYGALCCSALFHSIGRLIMAWQQERCTKPFI